MSVILNDCFQVICTRTFIALYDPFGSRVCENSTVGRIVDERVIKRRARAMSFGILLTKNKTRRLYAPAGIRPTRFHTPWVDLGPSGPGDVFNAPDRPESAQAVSKV